jgi:hypothetical protein
MLDASTACGVGVPTIAGLNDWIGGRGLEVDCNTVVHPTP